MVSHCESAPPVPYWSYMRGSSKICRPPMVDVMMTKMSVGRRLGTVIAKNCRSFEAPSIAAAS